MKSLFLIDCRQMSSYYPNCPYGGRVSSWRTVIFLPQAPLQSFHGLFHICTRICRLAVNFEKIFFFVFFIECRHVNVLGNFGGRGWVVVVIVVI